MSAIPVTLVSWKSAWRIIPSRFPPIDLFRRVAPAADWDYLNEIEGMTNERLRDGEGAVNLVRPEDRLVGPGTSLIMAPFTHPNPEGEWLSDGTFGICHVAEEFDAALGFSVRRRESFLRRTGEGPMTVQMRVLNLDLHGMLHDLRGLSGQVHTDRHSAVELGRRLREEGSWGIICDPSTSPLAPGAAIFRPTVLSNCRQERHLAYEWDGQRITKIYDYSTGKELQRPAVSQGGEATVLPLS